MAISPYLAPLLVVLARAIIYQKDANLPYKKLCAFKAFYSSMNLVRKALKSILAMQYYQ